MMIDYCHRVRNGHIRQRALIESGGADVCYTFGNYNICDVVAVINPRLVVPLKCPHIPGAGDGQGAPVVQRPGQVIAAFAGGDDGRLLRALRHPGDRAAVVLHHVLGPTVVVRRVIGRGGDAVEAVITNLRCSAFKMDLRQRRAVGKCRRLYTFQRGGELDRDSMIKVTKR